MIFSPNSDEENVDLKDSFQPQYCQVYKINIYCGIDLGNEVLNLLAGIMLIATAFREIKWCCL